MQINIIKSLVDFKLCLTRIFKMNYLSINQKIIYLFILFENFIEELGLYILIQMVFYKACSYIHCI